MPPSRSTGFLRWVAQGKATKADGKAAPARFADAAVIAFQFGHAMLTLVIAGRAFMPLMQEAPSLAAESHVLIQYNDPEYGGPAHRCRGRRL